MDSRTFIKNANLLTIRIKDLSVTLGSHETIKATRDAVQRDLNQLFSGLQNPTLPSASKLCATALNAGLVVDTKLQHRLQQAESCW